MRSFQRWLVVLCAGVAALGCSSPFGSKGRIDISPNPLVTAPRSGSVQFTATAYSSDGVALSPQPTFTWASGNLTVATIASTGAHTATATMLPPMNLGSCVNRQGTS